MFLYRYTLPLSKEALSGKIMPLGMEFPVNPLCDPVIVSGSKRPLIWLHGNKGVAKAAIRDVENFETDIIDAVTAMGIQSEWGNVHSCDVDGFKACIAHLRYYDIDKISAVSASEEHLETIGKSIDDDNLETDCQDWVTDGVIFIPQDRQYLGFVADVVMGRIVFVVQNPSRGLAIAR